MRCRRRRDTAWETAKAVEVTCLGHDTLQQQMVARILCAIVGAYLPVQRWRTIAAYRHCNVMYRPRLRDILGHKVDDPNGTRSIQ